MGNETDSVEYRFGYEDSELTRLGIQHRHLTSYTQLFWQRAGFKPGMTVVDLGCGPGYTTVDLARQVDKTGTVIAVDRDSENSLPHLKSRLESMDMSNVEVIAEELDSFDLAPNSVDGVYGRWVLMYLPKDDVEGLINRVARWLKPGGVFASVEICNYLNMGIHPRSDLMDCIARAFYESVNRESEGYYANIGNYIPGMMQRAGLEVDITVTTPAIRSGSEKWEWPDTFFKSHLPSLVEMAFISSSQKQDFLDEWEERAVDSESIFFPAPLMEAIGVKK